MPIRRLPAWIGLLTAVLAVTLATLAIYPLARIARPASLSVVYLPAVLVIAAYWGLRLGLLTSVASARRQAAARGDRAARDRGGRPR